MITPTVDVIFCIAVVYAIRITIIYYNLHNINAVYLKTYVHTVNDEYNFNIIILRGTRGVFDSNAAAAAFSVK